MAGVKSHLRCKLISTELKETQHRGRGGPSVHGLSYKQQKPTQTDFGRRGVYDHATAQITKLPMCVQSQVLRNTGSMPTSAWHNSSGVAIPTTTSKEKTLQLAPSTPLAPHPASPPPSPAATTALGTQSKRRLPVLTSLSHWLLLPSQRKSPDRAVAARESREGSICHFPLPWWEGVHPLHPTVAAKVGNTKHTRDSRG